MGFAKFLLLLPVLAASGVDVEPPEVPNPYNTSEGRAIRDVMEEVYRQKASDKLSVEELRAIYRKAWNDDQQRRLDAGQQPDEKWLNAYRQERDQETLDALRRELVRMGGTTGDQMDATALEAAIAARRAAIAEEQKLKAEAEERSRREAVIRQIEAEQRIRDAQQAPAKGAEKKPASVTMIIPKDGFSISDEDLVDRLVALEFKPEMTAKEVGEIRKEAERTVKIRNELIKGGFTLAFYNPLGIEVWVATLKDDDPEKFALAIQYLNYSGKSHRIHSIDIDFANSKRNEAHNEVRASFLMTSRFGLNKTIGKFFREPDQTIHFPAVLITQE